MKSKLYTLAEVTKLQEKAQQDSVLNSVEFIYEFVLLAMLDNGVDRDTARSVMGTADSLIEAIVQDAVCLDDIRSTLKNEYNMEVEFKPESCK